MSIVRSNLIKIIFYLITITLVITGCGEKNDSVYYYKQGCDELDSGKYYLAVGAFDKAVDLSEDPAPEVYFKRASAKLHLSDFNGSKTDLLKVVNLKPDFIEAHFLLGVVSDSMNRITDATEYYKRAIILNPNYKEAIYGISNIFLKSKDTNNAILGLEKLLKLNPNHKDALLLISKVYLENDRSLLLSNVYAGRLKMLDSTCEEAYIICGRCDMKFLNTKSALTNFNKALVLNPENGDAYIYRSTIYLFNEKKFSKALSDVNKSISINKDNFKAYFLRSLIFSAMLKLDAALADINKSIKINPDNGAAFYLRGLIENEKGMIMESEKDIKKAQKMGFRFDKSKSIL
jgi:tetratricopeptide (TPR) repeat protein